MSEVKVKTDDGIFVQDESGLWHYHHTSASGMVHDAAADALAHKPKGAAWFWFNSVPAPICQNDNAIMLASRWDEWRHAAYRSNEPLALLHCLASLAPLPVTE